MARRGQGTYRLGLEADVGREFMRVYESLREIDGEIGGEDGLGGVVGVGWGVL